MIRIIFDYITLISGILSVPAAVIAYYQAYKTVKCKNEVVKVKESIRDYLHSNELLPLIKKGNSIKLQLSRIICGKSCISSTGNNGINEEKIIRDLLLFISEVHNKQYLLSDKKAFLSVYLKMRSIALDQSLIIHQKCNDLFSYITEVITLLESSKENAICYNK